jgi:hypothetical protein
MHRVFVFYQEWKPSSFLKHDCKQEFCLAAGAVPAAAVLFNTLVA